MAAIIGWLALSFAVSFLLGSIPWGVIVSKLAYHKDIRDEGSGNIGTTNAFRAMGKVGGALVFVLDFGKGLLSGWLAFWFWAPLAGWAEIDYSLAGATLPATVEGLPVDAGALALALAFAGCTLGHIFSPWLKFKGGKGILSGGVLVLMLDWRVALIAWGLFAVLWLTTRYVSLGSVAATASMPVSVFLLMGHNWLYTVLSAAVAALVIWCHRGNIRRLLTGTEKKFQWHVDPLDGGSK